MPGLKQIGAALFLMLALLVGGCDNQSGNPAPPKIDTPANFPKQNSTIVVPLTIDLSLIQSELNRATPTRLWSINQREQKCVPAQRVTICPFHKKKCKGKECKNVACKIGFKKAKVTPDVPCTIVGRVTRGPIRLSGRGDVLAVSFPVRAVISARDVGGVIKKETANGAANVNATARLSINRAWGPVAKVNIDYNWTNPPGIDFLGKRINFASKADAKLAQVIAGLERDLAREISKAQTRAIVEGAWRQGFASIMLNREKPPAWMRITPQKLNFGGYKVRGKQLEMTLAAETITETFIGDRPEPVAPTPLPPPGKIGGQRAEFPYSGTRGLCTA